MVRIQLENGYLDVKEGSVFPLNFNIGDIRDISKRKGNFSKTLELTGSDNNHKLLGNRFDVNIKDGTFDINKITSCQVLQNGLPIMEDAYLQLVEVVNTQANGRHYDKVSYKALIKDSVATLNTAVGNKLLTDINLSEYDHTSNATDIVASFTNTQSDGYKYYLPWNNDENYGSTGLAPAIYAKTYFDKIFEGAGFTYQWDELTDMNFDKLMIPYNGDVPQFNYDDYFVKANRSTFSESMVSNNGTGNFNFNGFNNGFSDVIDTFTETQDDENLFDPATGIYTVPWNLFTNSSVTVDITITYEWGIRNISGTDAVIVNSGANLYPTNYSPFISVYKGSDTVNPYTQASINQYSGFDTYSGGTLLDGDDLVFESITKTISIPLANADELETFFFKFKTSNQIGYLVAKDLATETSFVDCRFYIDVASLEMTIAPSSNTAGYNKPIYLNQYIPSKIKQSDFIKSIFNMYNLYAESDKSQPNKIVLTSRDSFYDNGTEKDWSSKLAKDKQQVVKFLPELSKKKQVLTYKADKDDANEVYTEATDEVYGQLEYTFENEYVKGEDKKELIFSPTPITSTSFGAVVPMLSVTPKTNIRILFDGGVQTCDSFNISDTNTIGEFGLTSAPLLSHFDDPINPSFDINFGTCDYYFYNEWNSRTNNTLFNLYWRRTFNQIDTGKMLTAYFHLDEGDIQALELSDKIYINNSWWNINQVKDYDANSNSLTKVELISVDDGLKFKEVAATTSVVPPVVVVKPNVIGKPIKPTKPQRPVRDLHRKNNEFYNVYLPNQDLIIKGKNININPDVKYAVVLGDGFTVEQNGFYGETATITTSINLPDGSVWTEQGITGSAFNFISAGRDEVLNAFSFSTNYKIEGGIDTVRNLGSSSPINIVNAKTDEV